MVTGETFSIPDFYCPHPDVIFTRWQAMAESTDHSVGGARRTVPRFTLARRFAKSKRGNTAIEFGLLAVPFLTIVLAILETALVFYGQVMLDSGLNEAARLIRTGQAQELGLTATTFRNEVCARVYGMIDCDDTLYVDVRSYDNFQDIALPDPMDPDGQVQNDDFAYDAGNEGEIVVARAFYEMFIFTPSLWGIGLGNMASGNRLLTSTATFRNEPFGAILGQ
jgi:Flp pilus assembly protein TadG